MFVKEVKKKQQLSLQEFVKTYGPYDFFRRFELFRFVILTFLLGSFTSLLITAFRTGVVSTGIAWKEFIILYFSKFLFAYWWDHPLLIILLVIIFCFLWFNALRGIFENRIEFIARPKLPDPKVTRIFKRINRCLIVALIVYMFLLALPIMHLFNLNWYAVLTPVIIPAALFIQRQLAALSGTDHKFVKPVSGYTFNRVSYQSASGDAICEEVKDEMRKFQLIKSQTAVGADLLLRAAHSTINKFSGLPDLFDELALLFDPKRKGPGNLSERITLHNKTSEAIGFALQIAEANAPDAHIIYSDAEFLCVQHMLARYSNSTMIPGCEQSLLKDSFSEDKYCDEITRVIDTKKQKHKSFFIILTHVFHQTGRVLKINQVIGNVMEQMKKPGTDYHVFFIIDGAQALGNICMDEKILDACDFYAACSHKWLLGQFSLGILLRNNKLLKEKEIDSDKKLKEINEKIPYSSKNKPDKSIPPEPYIGASIMLSDINHCGIKKIEKHNRALAQHFVDGLLELNSIFPVVNRDCDCGMVTIDTHCPANIVNNMLFSQFEISGDLFKYEDHDAAGKSESLPVDKQKVTILPSPTSTESGKHSEDNLIPGRMLRFSFHYFMDERDVNKLLYALADIAWQLELAGNI